MSICRVLEKKKPASPQSRLQNPFLKEAAQNSLSAWMLLRHQGNKQLSLALATSFFSWHVYPLSVLQTFDIVP